MHITDAQLQAALAFLRSQTTSIETGVNAAPRPEIQYPFLIPVDDTANPFAKTVTYVSSDMHGKAKWVNGNSDDIPIAGTDMAQHETNVYTAGIGYGYGYEELEQARMLGIPLTDNDAQAARQGYEEFVDRVALKGDAEKGFNGLINHPGVTVAGAPTGTWGGASEDLILADINSAILGIATDTNYVGMADTILLPHEALSLLATRRLGDNGISILQFLRENNAYTATTGQPLAIRGVRGLSTAGAGGVRRMVAYHRNPLVLKLHIPMPHQFLEAMRTGPLNYVVPGIFRMAGLDIRRPREVRYLDGI